MPWVARSFSSLLLACSALGACGPDAASLSACENVAFKMRLCEVSQPPVGARDIDVCGGELTPSEICRLECWYDADCVEWGQADPSPDVSRCLSNCGDSKFDCGDGITLAAALVCDGEAQCPDESDEAGCDPP